MAQYSCVNHAISRAFYKYGKLIARHPLLFLISPCIIMILLCIGISQIEINGDVEYLFTPEDCKARQDGEFTQEHFLLGTEGGNFLPNRELVMFNRRGRIIVTAMDGGSALRQDIMEELMRLDERVRTFTVDFNDTETSYNRICQKWMGECVDNQLLLFYRDRVSEFSNITVTYPQADLPLIFGQSIPLMIGPNFGGVKLKDSNVVESVFAIRLFYSLGLPIEEDHLAFAWEEEFIQVMQDFQNETSLLKIAASHSETLSTEINEASFRVIPRFISTFCMLIVFAVFSCIMRDWVQSKPWLGLVGVVNAAFSIVSAIGFLSLIGMPYNEMVSLMPFLILGVGVDNMFIMIAAWRQLSLFLSVEERMGRTFSEAAVSITITNLTTVLAFIIGASSPLPGVRTFCIYAGIAMFFVYFYQMTFFGASMALVGQREANNLHCYTCKKVLPREESPNKFYMIFCSGGISRTKHKGSVIDLEHRIMKFFRLYYAPFITKRWVKTIVLILYILYLSGALYGCSQIKQGLALKNLAMDNSPAFEFYDLEDVHFRDVGPAISVVFKDEVEYWDQEVQEKIENMTQELELNDHAFGEELTQSWLRDFCKYWQAFLLYRPDENVKPGKDGFMYVLTEHFLKDPRYSMYQLDIVISEDDTAGVNRSITQSRVMLQTKNLHTLTDETETMLSLRETAEASPFDVIVYHPAFVLYESYVGIIPNLLQTLGIALACMFLVAVIMIPHPVCAVWVSLCVISIDVAVLGYMSLWGVNIDPISMVNIILCIGFSVDFSAHITYAFVVAPKENPDDRAKYALHALGMAILQGALSSIIAISALSTAPIYIFRIFFKTLFLVMVFGAMHGLVILPVVLTFMGRCMPHQVTREHEDEKEKLPEDGHQPAVAAASSLLTIPLKTMPGEHETIVDLRVTTV
ncbi:patched domain-containing protein 3-like isoform X1 [Asterias rubens]|uniref:patched domain-containing protein 3-like isoform X1 n=1 Tax=Asterias rubens TaxID=7604 RepID=UPI0014557AA5|nr:patched domain-containing protein 3-like isoform X1 [Asterias rubens]XP_033644621.1 patched domain-containing protein 3-like isoform X1 [Asterias rubens]XP_033644622.1 patched domain-containing protein 3-like isoform X1 [Asterias rubens]